MVEFASGLAFDFDEMVGKYHVVMITLDTLRYDAAQHAFESGKLKTLQQYLPDSGWEKRHSPASFTYAAHHAFFAGFLPTPVSPGVHPRLFAGEFAGSVSTHPRTFCFQQSTLPLALADKGYRTVCIGGTGFFNLGTEQGKELPGQFQQAVWEPALGVADRESHVNQINRAIEICRSIEDSKLLLFINVAAIHQPNWFYHPAEKEGEDSLESHEAALVAVDGELNRLFEMMKQRGPTFCLIFSDHGTAYGEEGYSGHRIGHPVVWEVPYAEFVL